MTGHHYTTPQDTITMHRGEAPCTLGLGKSPPPSKGGGVHWLHDQRKLFLFIYFPQNGLRLSTQPQPSRFKPVSTSEQAPRGNTGEQVRCRNTGLYPSWYPSGWYPSGLLYGVIRSQTCLHYMLMHQSHWKYLQFAFWFGSSTNCPSRRIRECCGRTLKHGPCVISVHNVG